MTRDVRNDRFPEFKEVWRSCCSGLVRFRYAGVNDTKKARLFDMAFKKFLQALANVWSQWTVLFLRLTYWSDVSDRPSLETRLRYLAHIFQWTTLVATGYFRHSTTALDRHAGESNS